MHLRVSTSTGVAPPDRLPLINLISRLSELGGRWLTGGDNSEILAVSSGVRRGSVGSRLRRWNIRIIKIIEINYVRKIYINYVLDQYRKTIFMWIDILLLLHWTKKCTPFLFLAIRQFLKDAFYYKDLIWTVWARHNWHRSLTYYWYFLKQNFNNTVTVTTICTCKKIDHLYPYIYRLNLPLLEPDLPKPFDTGYL